MPDGRLLIFMLDYNPRGRRDIDRQPNRWTEGLNRCVSLSLEEKEEDS